MKFKFYTSGNSTYIEAFFEKTDNNTSKRIEGLGTEITNRNPLVFFNKKYTDIHPDIIGLVCLAIFYPFIGESVTFPLPVSNRLAKSISRDIFTKNKKLNIKHIDNYLLPYTGESGEILAFGGGMDSSAIRALFPEAFVVHEASIRDGILIPDEANNLTRSLELLGLGSLVETNARYISEPGGWHVWIGSIVTALLEAGSRKAKYIYSGTILGSAFMNNGSKYFDRHMSSKWHGPSGNYWQQLFWDIGIPLVQPLMGCSEILTMQASLKHLPREEVSYCTAKNGLACGVCPKCFRRYCIENYLTARDFDFNYFNNTQVNSVLNKRPLYFAHIYAAMISDGWTAPSFIKERFNFLPTDNSFPLGFNPESLYFIPEELKSKIKRILYDNFREMTKDEIYQMKKWNQYELQPSI